jgi:hypothetical protein
MFFEERESETFGFSLFRFGLIFNPFRIMSAIWVRSRVLLPFFFFLHRVVSVWPISKASCEPQAGTHVIKNPDTCHTFT